MNRVTIIIRSSIPWLVAFLMITLVDYARCAESGTVLEKIRIGHHEGFQRMVLDLKGARPLRIYPLQDEGIVIEYRELRTSVQPEPFASRLPLVISGMTFQKKDDVFQIKILFHDRNVSASRSLISSSPSSNGSYRLVLDFTTQRSPEKLDEKAASPNNMTSSQPPSAAPEKADGKPVSGNGSKKDKGKSTPISPGKPAPPPPMDPDGKAVVQPPVADPKADPLYDAADETFIAHREELSKFAPQILGQYLEAIKAGPRSHRVPLSLYRCGVTYLAVLDRKKAEECFKRIIAEYPSDPSIGPAWLGMAKSNQLKRSFPEAILSFRTALSYPMEKGDKIEALYSLGKSLSHIRSHQETIDVLGKCLAEDPTYYQQKPDLLKVMGEAYSGMQQYDKSGKNLLWYLNLQKEVPERDLVLARFAEALLHQDQRKLADKVYAYIQKNYPNSEGQAISEIRKAEVLEQQGADGETKALEIYKALSQKPLSAALSRLIIFKLASWEWKHGNFQRSMVLLDAVLSNRTDSTAFDECWALKEKVIVDWAKQAISEKNYAQVVELYRDNKPVFQSQNSQELNASVAESFGEIKAYPNAIEMYQTLLNEKDPKNEEWLYKIARYYFLMGNMDKAVQTCSQIHSEPFEARKTELLAKISFAQGHYKEAVQYFDRIFVKGKEIEPGQVESVLQHVEGLLHVGRYEDGVACTLNASKRLGEGDAEQRVQLSLLRSKCHQKLGQPQKAVEALEAAIPLVQSEHLRDRLNYQLSLLYMEIKDYKKATEKLVQLAKSSQPLWRIAAQQQLNYIQMQNSESKPVAF
jgi:tetratricopeptide (TPR) repeat protein